MLSQNIETILGCKNQKLELLSSELLCVFICRYGLCSLPCVYQVCFYFCIIIAVFFVCSAHCMIGRLDCVHIQLYQRLYYMRIRCTVSIICRTADRIAEYCFTKEGYMHNYRKCMYKVKHMTNSLISFGIPYNSI